MQIDEIIQKLEMLKAEIEWNYTLDYQIAIDAAIKILESTNGQGAAENR